MLARLSIGLVALVALTAFAPVPPPRLKKADPRHMLLKMKGTWRTVSTERMLSGRLTRSATKASTRNVRIEGNTWSFVYPNPPAGLVRAATTYQINLDTTKSPVWFDLTREGLATVYMRGVLTLEGGTLKLCYVLGSRGDMTGRPASASVPGEGEILMTLERIKEETP